MPRDARLYMTFPIDFWTHPKVARLSDSAFRAFVESNGHSRMRETDGVIEQDDAEFLWSPEALAELVKSHPSRPLMLRNDAGEYVLRDYAEHQFTKADRDELTEKRSRAGKASADKRRASAERVLSKPEHPATEIGKGKEISPSKEGDTPRTRGSRIPEPFIVTAEMRQWAAGEVPSVDVDKATRMFVDYWRAKTGKDATKQDWIGTWRNWLRREQPTPTTAATPERKVKKFVAHAD